MYATAVKRVLDAIAAAVSLFILSPLLLVVAAAITIEDRGPAIFRQHRVGRYGRAFTIYKFRSMPIGTPNLPSNAAQQLRITRVGRVIRRTNIDELPQLWNVLKGDMSLIGPRPALPSQSSLLAGRQERGITDLRPGLTGLAQVNAYAGMPEAEKLEWESRYARGVSLWCDAVIVMRTVGYLMRRPPAY